MTGIFQCKRRGNSNYQGVVGVMGYMGIAPGEKDGNHGKRNCDGGRQNKEGAERQVRETRREMNERELEEKHVRDKRREREESKGAESRSQCADR